MGTFKCAISLIYEGPTLLSVSTHSDRLEKVGKAFDGVMAVWNWAKKVKNKDAVPNFVKE